MPRYLYQMGLLRHSGKWTIFVQLAESRFFLLAFLLEIYTEKKGAPGLPARLR
jgi:hypothetical protein